MQPLRGRQDGLRSPSGSFHERIMRMHRCSACLIVRNEQRSLERTLRSLAGLVQEIIVVDTGSVDRTKDVAARLGARVADFRWVDDFAAARNESLRLASGDWIFWLDADEWLDQENRHQLRELFGKLKDENAAYVMQQRSGPEAGTGAATPVDQVRLFRNPPDIRWP